MEIPRSTRSTLDMSLFGLEFFSFWTRSNETGVNLGVQWPKHNVHLTIYWRNDVLNCHITDGPRRVWQKEMAFSDLQKVVEKTAKRLFGRWGTRERFYPLSLERLQEAEALMMTEGKVMKIDLAEYVRRFAPAFIELQEGPVNLSRVIKEEPAFGVQRRWFRWNFIIAAPEGTAARLPLDPRRSPLKSIPTFEGMLRYMRYLEKQGFFDFVSMHWDDAKTQRLLGELELVLSSTKQGPDRQLGEMIRL